MVGKLAFMHEFCEYFIFALALIILPLLCIHLSPSMKHDQPAYLVYLESVFISHLTNQKGNKIHY
jgi:hypothetical protein